jgi:hypothetical protein
LLSNPELREHIHQLIKSYHAVAGGDLDNGGDDPNHYLGFNWNQRQHHRMQRNILYCQAYWDHPFKCNQGCIYVFMTEIDADAFELETGPGAKKVGANPQSNPHYAKFKPIGHVTLIEYYFSSSTWAPGATIILHSVLGQRIRFWVDELGSIQVDRPKWNPYWRLDREQMCASACGAAEEKCYP